MLDEKTTEKQFHAITSALTTAFESSDEVQLRRAARALALEMDRNAWLKLFGLTADVSAKASRLATGADKAQASDNVVQVLMTVPLTLSERYNLELGVEFNVSAKAGGQLTKGIQVQARLLEFKDSRGAGFKSWVIEAEGERHAFDIKDNTDTLDNAVSLALRDAVDLMVNALCDLLSYNGAHSREDLRDLAIATIVPVDLRDSLFFD